MSDENSLLDSTRFRREREADWRRLDALLERVAKKSSKALSEEELIDLPRLYRSTLSALSVARTTSLDKNAVSYLESLCTRAYFFIYGSRSTFGERVSSFLRRDWPDAIRRLRNETLAALAFLTIGAVAAFMLVSNDPDWFYSFVPGDLAAGRTPSASTESLRGALYEGGGGLSVFATSLFTHNAGIAIFAFALGFAFCAPTAVLLIWNGCILGAFLAVYVSRGLGFELGGWLLIHGVTELFAIALAGAAGMHVGWAIADPGSRTRLQAAAEASRPAGLALAGVIVMLFFAGLLEGFGRQLILNDTARYAVAVGTGALWCAYFYVGRMERRP
ncbi:MAG: stage II sporulation protein M [Pseudomonadota bacterium]